MIRQHSLIHRLSTEGENSEDDNKANEEKYCEWSCGTFIINPNQTFLEVALFCLVLAAFLLVFKLEL